MTNLRLYGIEMGQLFNNPSLYHSYHINIKNLLLYKVH